jgi:hypothetical protein
MRVDHGRQPTAQSPKLPESAGCQTSRKDAHPETAIDAVNNSKANQNRGFVDDIMIEVLKSVSQQPM